MCTCMQGRLIVFRIDVFPFVHIYYEIAVLYASRVRIYRRIRDDAAGVVSGCLVGRVFFFFL